MKRVNTPKGKKWVIPFTKFEFVMMLTNIGIIASIWGSFALGYWQWL